MPRSKKTPRLRTSEGKGVKHKVTVGQLPLVQCELCKKKMAYQPKKTTASKVLTDHYKKVHGIG